MGYTGLDNDELKALYMADVDNQAAKFKKDCATMAMDYGCGICGLGKFAQFQNWDKDREVYTCTYDCGHQRSVTYYAVHYYASLQESKPATKVAENQVKIRKRTFESYGAPPGMLGIPSGKLTTMTPRMRPSVPNCLKPDIVVKMAPMHDSIAPIMAEAMDFYVREIDMSRNGVVLSPMKDFKVAEATLFMGAEELEKFMICQQPVTVRGLRFENSRPTIYCQGDYLE